MQKKAIKNQHILEHQSVEFFEIFSSTTSCIKRRRTSSAYFSLFTIVGIPSRKFEARPTENFAVFDENDPWQTWYQHHLECRSSIHRTTMKDSNNPIPHRNIKHGQQTRRNRTWWNPHRKSLSIFFSFKARCIICYFRETGLAACKKYLTLELLMSILVGLVICGIPLAVVASLYVQKSKWSQYERISRIDVLQLLPWRHSDKQQ